LEGEVDLVVCGAGAAGMATALAASLEGLEVVLCEKTGQVGGTSATSAGTVWIPRDTQEAETYLRHLMGDSMPQDKVAAYLATGPAAIEYFAARSEVKFVAAGRHPDYRELPGAAAAGRAWSPLPFDGRLLGEDFKRVRPPIEEFLVLGGMMVGKADIPPLVGRFRSAANFLYALRLFCRYVLDRLSYPRGTRLLMGNALVARLLHSLRKNGVRLQFDSEVTEILRDGNRVIGVRGHQSAIKARKGVVLATGGLPQKLAKHSLSFAGNTGDGVALGAGNGGTVASGHRTGAFWAPVSVTRRRDGSEGLFPHLLLDRAKPGLIAVNAAGRRFVNEACSYHDFAEAQLASPGAIPAWLVCDAAFVRKYGLGVIHPGAQGPDGYAVSADSLEALAAKLSIDAAALRDTVARYNSLAASGVDTDFGKGTAELDRFNGDPGHTPNPCMAPIERPPYYALAVWPADLGRSTGLATDADGRVLDGKGAPIPGLYACGSDMASIFMGTYPGPGTTLGPALTFGYRIAMHAARSA
jgi:succinate dehydrogenase/fumarate reductase flavoprotein subunit